MVIDRRPEAPTHTVPRDRGAHPPADGIRHPRRVVRTVGDKAQRDRAGSPPAGPCEGLERRTVANAPDQAERRFRPRDRRARSTARPPLVRMRRRKPWVLARLRLFGWYVRFNEEPPRGDRAQPEVGDRAGGGNQQVYGSGASHAMRSPVWGKPSQPLVAQGRRCYVARLARRRPAVRTSPVSFGSTWPARVWARSWRSPHLWTLLWTTKRDRERDGRRHLGSRLGDPTGPARARHLGCLVPRRAPAHLRRHGPAPQRPELPRRRADPVELLGHADRRHPRLHRRHRPGRPPGGDRPEGA